MFLSSEVQSFGKLVKDSFRAFAILWKKLLPVFIIQWLATITIITLFFFIGVVHLASSRADMMAGAGMLFGFSAWLIFFTVWSYFISVLYVRADGVLHDDQHKISHAWKIGWQRFCSFMGTALLLGLILCTLGFVGFLITMAASSFVGAIASTLSMVVIAVLLFLFTIRLWYLFPLVTSRNESVFGAFSTSMDLTKGYVWCLVGVIVITFFIPAHLLGSLYYLTALVLPQGVSLAIIYGILLLAQFVIVTSLALSGVFVCLNDSELKLKLKNS